MPFFFVMLVWLSTGLLLPGAEAAGPAALRGAALIDACAACHGPDGRSQGAIPTIDNLSAKDFVAALEAFRTGARQGTVMNYIAKGVDHAEIAAMAAYIADRHGLNR